MTTTYSITRDQLIAAALRKLGVLEVTDTPDATTLAVCAVSLNLLVKQFATDGLKLWKNTEIKIPLTASQTVYTLGGSGSTLMYDVQNSNALTTDKPLKAIQGWYRNIQSTPYIDTPCLILSKQEYNILGSKYSTGATNSFFYDVKQTYGLLYLYLTPDLNVQTNSEFHLVVQMPMQDLNTSSDIPDFPNEWYNCLVWNLADQLAIEYGVPLGYRQEIAQRALMYKEQMNDFDVDYASTFFQPDYRNVNASAYSR